MWKKHGSMPEECIWIGALGEYPGPSPLLKDEACRAQRGQVTYARSQSEFVSRPRAHPGLMFFFNPVVLHCPKIVGNAWTKKVLFLQFVLFLHLTFLNIEEMCRENWLSHSHPTMALDWLAMAFILLSSLWLFGSNSPRNDNRAGDYGAVCTVHPCWVFLECQEPCWLLKERSCLGQNPCPQESQRLMGRLDV